MPVLPRFHFVISHPALATSIATARFQSGPVLVPPIEGATCLGDDLSLCQMMPGTYVDQARAFALRVPGRTELSLVEIAVPAPVVPCSVVTPVV